MRRRYAPPNAGKQFINTSCRVLHSSTRLTLTWRRPSGECSASSVSSVHGKRCLVDIALNLARRGDNHSMKTIGEAAAALRARQVSCEELVKHALSEEEAHRDLNCFITVTAEQALEEARRLDAELVSGRDRGPLHGIPIAHKDLFHTAGVRTTNGTRIFADFVPDLDAVAVTRLREAGAVSIGKLNMHELAYGITSNNPHYGPVRNPHNRNRIPGGSSGGSGAAVSAGILYAATGSDTGGSIRIPAAFCGVVGFKPTYGTVSTE